MDKIAKPDVLSILSEKWSISRDNLLQVVKATIFRGDAAKATTEDLVVFLSVCAKYDLNPFLREIYAFVDRRGGVVPIVGIDGWISLRNRDPRFNGIQFEDLLDNAGNIVACTCRIWLKDMERPIEVTEYMKECQRDTEPWKKWPARMIRHKAHGQAVRSAFGYSGIYDEDEAERIRELDITPPLPESPLSIAQAAAAPPQPAPEPKAPAQEPPPIGEPEPAPMPAAGKPGELFGPAKFPRTPDQAPPKGYPRKGTP